MSSWADSRLMLSVNTFSSISASFREVLRVRQVKHSDYVYFSSSVWGEGNLNLTDKLQSRADTLRLNLSYLCHERTIASVLFAIAGCSYRIVCTAVRAWAKVTTRARVRAWARVCAMYNSYILVSLTNHSRGYKQTHEKAVKSMSQASPLNVISLFYFCTCNCQRASRAKTRGWWGGSIIEPCESIV